MATKMVILTDDGHSEVFEYGANYNEFKIEDGVLIVILNFLPAKIYAKGYWKKIEFNR